MEKHFVTLEKVSWSVGNYRKTINIADLDLARPKLGTPLVIKKKKTSISVYEGLSYCLCQNMAADLTAVYVVEYI